MFIRLAKNLIFLLCILLWMIPFNIHGQNRIDSLEQELGLEKSDSLKVQLHTHLGQLHRLIGAHDSSLMHFQYALDYYQSQNNKKAEADLIIEIGETYRNNDVPDRAMDYFLQGIKIYEERNHFDGITTTYNKMADLVMRQNDYPKAKMYSEKVDEILRHSPYPPAKAHWYMNKGRIFNSERQFDSAIYYHQLAIDLFDSVQMYHDKGRALHNRANSLRELHRYDEAMALCLEALDIPDLRNNIKSQIFTILLISNIYQDTNQLDKSIEYCLQGLALATKHNFMDRKRVALLYLSQTYERARSFDSAYYYHKRYANMIESIFDKEKYEQVNRLNTLYETEKKEQTIAIQQANLEAREATIALQQSRQNQLFYGIGFSILIGAILLFAYVQKTRTNQLLSQQKLEIEKQNSEREVLLKEIHHRVKNNLQVISSLLSMQSRKMKDSDAKVAVKEGQSRIKSMSLIHQKLYSEGNLSRINMKEYIADLSGFLFKSYKTDAQIEQLVEADEISLDVDTAVPLGLIINELISNALKYAFAPEEQGHVSIRLKKHDNAYQLQVADSGNGLPKDFDKKQSMGMRLVHILVDQLDADLQIDQTNGLLFTIIFSDKRAA
ncbi:MAG: histidine kinase dimerization/phosphoacceptor domain -containing protein [Reichenbachiella sp.]|uniref:tetratricopeptide repeat-containing sensor histidine kinase n=1 Tax=Reichenbachiella sp. TaxID=2184521 RepID=UPI0029661CE3|nr:histidine kinase dimerization/phosphoacceptor domain -containing protein [Reichenbachiella sp.]MDW3209349.1 histidine kinase dimerization/phosphoacceptor domain -containing protein [Reichenbachiella sp.]